ncbi:MAG TPA: hypothetical protein VE684_22375, partial [Crenalkalicoccus sp.]|nr:hypothetical protein [Crenalkalicoccus sp.]
RGGGLATKEEDEAADALGGGEAAHWLFGAKQLLGRVSRGNAALGGDALDLLLDELRADPAWADCR